MNGINISPMRRNILLAKADATASGIPSQIGIGKHK